jgi:acyl-CoA synthetase (AMP-forming)/AMP-acid ligase II/acyl carrier protein
VVAFFGCLYGGAVAVPACPPHPKRPMPRIEAILADSRPKAALTTAAIAASLERRFADVPGLSRLTWATTDNLAPGSEARWSDPDAARDTLALLQYTSGSTGDPKGVMITHGNLLHNLHVIHHVFRPHHDSVGVTWLPMYHDMGLIGGILEPLYSGNPAVLLSPTAFLQRPACWLEAISQYRGTINGGPNFAYDLCVDRITPEQRAALDLSCWEVAFTGAEPIRRQTLERFADAFAPCGFRSDAFYPCYGMAEATLLVSGGSGPGPLRSIAVDKRALDRHEACVVPENAVEAKVLVNCGSSVLDQSIAIVDPETAVRCPDGRVGEIWVTGPSVAQGYWNRPELTAQIFRACLKDSGERQFLRTGDLGFVREGELYITGRLKDLIIIRGRNHYPQDVELSVERSHAALRPGGGAAFSVERDGEERLVIVHEVAREALRGLPVDAVLLAMREAVSEQHELAADAVVLLQTGGLPKTSSGKTPRHACRAAFLDGTLNVVAQWRAAQKPVLQREDRVNGMQSNAVQPSPATPACNGKAGSDAAHVLSNGHAPLTAAAIQRWLVDWLARKLQSDPQAIAPDRSIASFGLDSLAAMELIRDAEQRLHRTMEAAMLWNFPTLEMLSRHLAEEPVALAPKSIAARADVHQPPGAACPQSPARNAAAPAGTMQFSLFYFSCDEEQVSNDKYRLLLE